MEFDDVIRTTFAAREFTPEPVSDETLHRILDRARFAPSGGNRQGWRVIVVRDPAARRRLAEICKPAWRRYQAQRAAGENPWTTVKPSRVSDAEVAGTSDAHPTLDVLDDPLKVPLLLVVTVDLGVVASMDQKLDRIGVISGASIYPFVWSLLLAARSEGLGGTLMTFLAAGEPEVKALLGIPKDHAVAAMIPMGRPVKQLTRLTRKPVEAFATLDRFDGDPLPAPRQ
jgi:nitroreductase